MSYRDRANYEGEPCHHCAAYEDLKFEKWRRENAKKVFGR